VEFAEGSDHVGSNARIVESGRESPSDEIETVEVVRGDAVVAEGHAPEPTVMKIDVEGFELEVLEGMGRYLASERLQAVCVEIHALQMEERGIRNGGRAVELLLRNAGFDVSWAGFGHIVATKVPSRH
jgi:hypothetical protein